MADESEEPPAGGPAGRRRAKRRRSNQRRSQPSGAEPLGAEPAGAEPAGSERGEGRSPLERLTPFRRNVALGVLGLLSLAFLWSVRSVLNPLILGYLLAFIAAPVVRRLKQRGFSHGAAVALIFGVAGLATLVLAGGLAYQGWHLTSEVLGEKSGSRTGIVERIEGRLAGGLEWTERKLNELGLLPEVRPAEAESQPAASGAAQAPPEPREELAGEPAGEPGEADEPEPSANAEAGDTEGRAEDESTAVDASTSGNAASPTEPSPGVLGELVRYARNWLTSEGAVGKAGAAGLRWTTGLMQFLFRGLNSLMGIGTLLLLLPVYTYFLLFQLDEIHDFVRRYLPRKDRHRIVRVGSQIGEVISNFFRGRLVVCLIKGLVTAAGLFVLGVPYALLFGLLGGFLSLVPFVGPLLAFALAFLIGLTEFSVLGSLWRVSLVFALAEVLEGYVLIPKVLGESLGLHPVVVLASVMVGGAALGFFGMLVALPLTASLVILAREFVMPALAAWADESR